MSEKTYYIDPITGDDSHNGLTPAHPFKTYASREFTGGDTILFKRGSVIRDILYGRNGSEGAPITYGAYGTGAKPLFLGSVSVSEPKSWIEERPSLWRYTGVLPSEACNLVFNNGASCGNLRWKIEDLQHPGEWHYTGMRNGQAEKNPTPGILYLYSPTNPGNAYQSIECVLWGMRKLIYGQHDIIFEDLSFRNSGVHGYQESLAKNIHIRRCDFCFIGGAVWDRRLRIRFGNAVEFWDGASDITVEGCLFNNIYDSGVTHQGGETRNIPKRLYFRNNLFIDCGMSAYESREPAQEVYFEYNTCINAGGGFSMQGEAPPRQSEIYPQPMGHHVFIWRIEPNTQPGHVYIRYNIFFEAPYGGAIYSVIDPVDERKFVLDNNVYWQTTGSLLNYMGGHSYLPAEFARYQAECQQDPHSQVAEPQFRDAKQGDYRLVTSSPLTGIGMQIDVAI